MYPSNERPNDSDPLNEDLTWLSEDDHPASAPRKSARVAFAKLATIGVAVAVLFGGWRAFRGDQTMRSIRADVERRVQFEAASLAKGDREIYLNLQDDGRRHALRRPDVATDDIGAVGAGPYPGTWFTADPPRVVAVVVADKADDNAVSAITATVQVEATDGARTGSFSQDRRMVRGADGGWRHADAPGARRASGAGVGVEWGGQRVQAEAQPADAPFLLPLLARADETADAYCMLVQRCGDRHAKLRFGIRRAGEHGTVLLPAPSQTWWPEDETARELIAFAVERSALFALDAGFRGSGAGAPSDGWADEALPQAFVDAWLAERTAPDDLAAWREIDAAIGPHWSLWSLDQPYGARPVPIQRGRPAAARSLAAYVAGLDRDAVGRILAVWPPVDADPSKFVQRTKLPLDVAFGDRALDVALDFPSRQAPYTLPVAAVIQCPNDWPVVRFVAAAGAAIADASSLACGPNAEGGPPVWRLDGRAFATGCREGRTQAADYDPMDFERRPGFVAVVARDAAAPDGWRVTRTPPMAQWDLNAVLAWSPDGRRLAWLNRSWNIGGKKEWSWDTFRDDVWVIDVTDRPSGALSTPRIADGPDDASREPAGGDDAGEGASDPAWVAPGLAWSPDGGALLASGTGGATLHRLGAARAEAGHLDGIRFAFAPDGRRIGRVTLSGGGAPASEPGPTTAQGDARTFRLSMVTADTLEEESFVALNDRALAAAFGDREPIERLDPGVAQATKLEWSSDGRWLAVAIQTDRHCGDVSNCLAAAAWAPETGELRAFANRPFPEGASGWMWEARWLPDSHRLALFNVGFYVGEPGETTSAAADDPTVAFVLDADADAVAPIARSEGVALAPVRTDYSPDGRWLARRDEIGRLIFEPSGAIGGYRADDPSSGWRLNASGCSPYVDWAAAP